MRWQKKIGRKDLEIKGKHILSGPFFNRIQISGLVIDHAARLTKAEINGLDVAYASVLANQSLETDGQIERIAGSGEV